LITASGRDELVRTVKEIRDALQRLTTCELRDVAYTLNCGAKDSCRVAIVASSLEDLASKLDQVLAKLGGASTIRRIKQVEGIYYFENPLVPQSGIAFLFPGEGSQYVGMLADLAIFFPEVRAWFDLMDQALWNKTTGRLPSHAIFPTGNGNEPIEWSMDEASEAVFSATQGLLAVMKRLEVHPDAVVGHSTGEYSALLAGGAVRVADSRQLMADILELNRVYRELSEQGAIPEGSLLAVGGCRREVVLDVIERHQPDILLAMDNCPNQAVLYGASQAIADALSELRAKGAVCDTLPFTRAYHTPLFEPFRQRVLQFLERLDVARPNIPIYSCTSAERFPDEPRAIRELAAAHWTHSVRFQETIERMYADGIRLFVEVGPRANLTAFVNDILRGRPHEAVPSNVPFRSGTTQINHLTGLLAAHGVNINFEPLYERRGCRKVDPFPVQDLPRSQRASIQLSMNLPRLTLPTQFNPTPATPAHAPIQPAAPELQSTSATQKVMDEYLRTMSMMLETQQQVMTAYLATRGVEKQVTADEVPSEPVVISRAAQDQERAQVATCTSAPGPQRRRPFIREIISIEAGKRLVAACVLEVDNDSFLRDHTLGRKISVTDPDLMGLPLVPLAISLEMMAESAALLAPDMLVTGLRDVVAHRWISVQDGSVRLRIVAERSEASSVRVEINDASSAESEGAPLISGTVLVAKGYFPGPEVASRRLAEERSVQWTRDEMYAAAMFTGPRLQGVASIEAVGSDGVRASLRAPELPLLNGNVEPGSLVLNPVLLDAAGQMIGFWTADRFETGFVVFPYGLKTMDIYAADYAAAAELLCEARITAVGDQDLSSTLILSGTGGRCYARIGGWMDRRFSVPRSLAQLVLNPLESFATEIWEDAASVFPETVIVSSIDARQNSGWANDEMWLSALAHLILSQPERKSFRSIGLSLDRRRDWLLGRLAAKDSVRRL
ncbi:MAG TPA: polyketide synthase dehydratase domain-containing protein, partial [Acidobacteriota bacterium]|nr:polyketide synthase dehydratase domain-containing protein [Acidobacteriota bacterium]